MCLQGFAVIDLRRNLTDIDDISLPEIPTGTRSDGHLYTRHS